MLELLAGFALTAVVASPVSASAQAPPGGLNLTGTVVVVNQQSDSVTLIDLKAMAAYRHVPVVGGPHEAAVSPDGRTVVVTNYNKRGVGPQKALSLLALPSGDTIRTIDLGEYRAPHDVRWVDDARVVCTSEANQALLVVNVETGVIERVFRTEAGLSGKWALVPHAQASSLVVADVASQVLVKSIKLGLTKVGEPSTAGVAPHPDSQHAFVTVRNDDSMLVLDLVSGETLGRVEVQSSPDGVAYSPVQR